MAKTRSQAMFTSTISAIRHFATRPFASRPFEWSRFAAALLTLGEYRLGLGQTGSTEDLNDHLRRDLGLPAAERSQDYRDLRW
jgi:hypothetical protein